VTLVSRMRREPISVATKTLFVGSGHVSTVCRLSTPPSWGERMAMQISGRHSNQRWPEWPASTRRRSITKKQ